MKVDRVQNYKTSFGAKIELNEPIQSAMRYIKDSPNVSSVLRQDFYRALKYIHFNTGMKSFKVNPVGKNFEIQTVENINLYHNPTNIFKTPQQSKTNNREHNIVQDIITYAKKRFADSTSSAICGAEDKFEYISIPESLEKNYGMHINKLINTNKNRYMLS